MSAPSDTLAEPILDRPAVAPAALLATRPFYWSVRRELWENRSLYVAPVAVAGVILFGFLVSASHLPKIRDAMSGLDPARQKAVLALPYDIAALAIIVTGLIVAMFYCLGALHNERRDRSVLFWKSLPVSDLVTVLSKAFVPLVVLPICLFAIILATQLIMLLTGSAFLAMNGMDAAAPWTQIPWPGMCLVLAYGLATLSLWYAPIGGWLLLVSGFARRAPFLWAVLPPLAVCLLEKLAFDTSNFSSLLSYRLGGFDQAFTVTARGKYMIGLPQIDAARFLATPGLWVGLAFAAAFLAAAIWQRRYREPV